jgi:MFS family permease
LDEAGLKAGSIMLLAIIGAPLGGYLSDLWVKKKVNARLVLASITTIISAVLIFAAFFLFDGTIQYAVLLLMGIFITAFLPGAAAVTQEVIHPGLRAMSYALAVIFMNLLGASLGPIVIGAISDASSIQTAMMVLPVFLVVAALLFFIGSFFFEKDYNRVERVQLQVEA